MNFNFGLLPHHEGLKKKNKKEILASRAVEAVRKWIAERRDFTYPPEGVQEAKQA